MDVSKLVCEPAHELKCVAFSTACKRSLTEVIQGMNSSYNLVMDKYKIQYVTLRKCYWSVKKELSVFVLAGRPAKLDSEGVDFVVQYLAENATYDTKTLHSHIRSKLRETLSRQYINDIPSIVSLKIPKTSVWTWARTVVHIFSTATANNLINLCHMM
jgi:hypothetical protein